MKFILNDKKHLFTVGKPSEQDAHYDAPFPVYGRILMAATDDIAHKSERFESTLNYNGIDIAEYDIDDVEEALNANRPKYYKEIEGEFLFNLPALKLLKEKGFEIPNLHGIAHNEIQDSALNLLKEKGVDINKIANTEFKDKDFFVGNLEYNINAGNIELANKSLKRFLNQNSLYAFCMISNVGGDLRNLLRDFGLKEKEFTTKYKEYNGRDYLYLAPSAIKAMLDAGLDFDKLPDFENKDKLTEGILSRSPSFEKMRFVEEILQNYKPSNKDVAQYKKSNGDPSSLGM